MRATHTRHMTKIGAISPTDALRIVQSVARIAETESAEIIEADLTFVPARFIGLLAPIVDAPAFCIRKIQSTPSIRSKKLPMLS
jgi:Flp pilus assembly CpaF family ATPase